VGQIFISYAREDKEFVDRLVRDVEAGGLDVWIDRDDIRPGEGWVGAIGRAIGACSSFVLVISSSSSKSRKVAQELCLADEYDKKVFPLRLQTCELSEDLKLLLAGRQWIDFEGDYAGGTQRLLAALGQQPPPQDKTGPTVSTDSVGGVSPPPPPRQPELTQVLPGQWTVTVNFPMRPPFNFTVWLGPDGSFRTQLPTGAFAQGGWGVNFGNQIVMQGVETLGMMSRPYYGQFSVTQFGAHYVNCFGPQGEAVFWQRSG
jgi:hypothetical protein